MNAPAEGRSIAALDRGHTIPAFAMAEADLLATLGDSIYPGAKPASIRMVVNYCKASLLDPFQKPVHIVPMSRKVKSEGGGKDYYVDVDTIMPGIGLYRTQAARSREHAGTSEPEFGPIKSLAFKDEVWEEDETGRRAKRARDAVVEYPEWCRVTVKRVIDGRERDFVACEYWIENYATAKRDTTAPNAMWKKRPRGQLAKCAEAQALRKAFPELGAAPTAEEAEGKWIDENGETTPPPPRQTVQSKSEAAKTTIIDVNPEAAPAPPPPQEPPKESPPATEGMLRLIRAKAKGAGVEESAILAAHAIAALEGITVAIGNEILTGIGSGRYKAAE